MPAPAAPAARQAARLPGVMPPTGHRPVPGGSTEAKAFRPAGPITSAGNSLSACAPAARAAKASVGVATPGIASMPSSRARAITAESRFGATISRPPARFTASTSATDSIVPPPTSASGGAKAAMRSMACSAPGRFSGTSTMRQPASNRRSATSAARSGSRPRRMATSGRSTAGKVGCMVAGARSPHDISGLSGHHLCTQVETESTALQQWSFSQGGRSAVLRRDKLSEGFTHLLRRDRRARVRILNSLTLVPPTTETS